MVILGGWPSQAVMEVIQVAPIQVGIWTVQIIYPLLGKWPMWVRSGCASYSAELSVLGR